MEKRTSKSLNTGRERERKRKKKKAGTQKGEKKEWRKV